MAIRLGYTNSTHLEGRGGTMPTAIGAAAVLPVAAAVGQLNCWQSGAQATLSLYRQCAGLRLEVIPPHLNHV
jgi:hypothetical protein